MTKEVFKIRALLDGSVGEFAAFGDLGPDLTAILDAAEAMASDLIDVSSTFGRLPDSVIRWWNLGGSAE